MQAYFIPAKAAIEAFPDGVVFKCSASKVNELSQGMKEYLEQLKIEPEHYRIQKSADGTLLNYVLTTPDEDTNTLNLSQRPEYNITPDTVKLPRDSAPKQIVSKKEIVLALFQHGRRTVFEKTEYSQTKKIESFMQNGCDIQSFKDHIGIRQNIAGWVDNVRFIFPGRTSAQSNPRYWSEYDSWNKDPSKYEKYGRIAVAGIHDIFMNSGSYRMGCYGAAKVSMIHGITDYFTRIRPDKEKLQNAISTLFAYGSPLESIEPGFVWKGFTSPTAEDLARREGKVLSAVTQVAKFNFVPGDWAYFKNTDFASSNRKGDEGSNAIYLGGNKFNNFYRLKFDKSQPPPPGYTVQQKISILASWGGLTGGGELVSPQLFSKLMKSPVMGSDGLWKFTRGRKRNQAVSDANGGFLLTHRLTPSVF